MTRDPYIRIKKIYNHLKDNPGSSVSGMSRELAMTRKTLTKYLKLIKWIQNQPTLFERRGPRGARIFSIRKEDVKGGLTIENILRKKPKGPITWPGRWRFYPDGSEVPLNDQLARELAYGLSEMSNVAYALDLPKDVLLTALNIYRRVWKAREICAYYEKMFEEDLMPSALYLACRQCEFAQSLDEIARTCDISKEKIEYCYRILKQGLRNNGKLTLVLARVTSNSKSPRE